VRTVGADGSTHLTVNEQNLNAGQNNGNTSKPRTGNDDGPMDKDHRQNNSGGSNGTSTGSSGGMNYAAR
jgi:hypothetical protein